MWHRMAFVSTDVPEERTTSIIRVRSISELETLAVTRNWALLDSVFQLLVIANVVSSSMMLLTLIIEAIHFSETSVLTRATRRNVPEYGNTVCSEKWFGCREQVTGCNIYECSVWGHLMRKIYMARYRTTDEIVTSCRCKCRRQHMLENISRCALPSVPKLTETCWNACYDMEVHELRHQYLNPFHADVYLTTDFTRCMFAKLLTGLLIGNHTTEGSYVNLIWLCMCHCEILKSVCNLNKTTMLYWGHSQNCQVPLNARICHKEPDTFL
jgi:hypothetical protein